LKSIAKDIEGENNEHIDDQVIEAINEEAVDMEYKMKKLCIIGIKSSIDSKHDNHKFSLFNFFVFKPQCTKATLRPFIWKYFCKINFIKADFDSLRV
jgi:hypothetical protein